MVTLTMIGSGQDPGTVVLAGIATVVAGIVSMSAGAWLGSKAEQDVRAGGIADKQCQVAEQPLVEQAKLARVLEQECLAPAAAWQQVGQTAAPDLCRALLEKGYSISETAPAARDCRTGAHRSDDSRHRPPRGSGCRRHRRPGCIGVGQSLEC